MKGYRLSANDKRLLRSLSTKPVEDYFIKRQNKLSRYEWLNKNNVYRRECTKLYEDQTRNQPPIVDHANLIDYICSSAPAHSIDGWSFFSRAIEALLNGDTQGALHLGYYAELRATMSLLACEGVGVLSRKHPVILPTMNQTRPLGKLVKPGSTSKSAGTHNIVWPLLEHWSCQKKAANRLDQLIAPHGITLTKWFDAAGVAPTLAIAKKWFSNWGMDLSQLDEDHRMRNLASYRPSGFRSPPTPTPKRLIEFVSDLWTLFEPGTERRFGTLERYLVRKALRQAKGSISAARIQQNFGLSPETAIEIAGFLSLNDDPLPIELAEKKLPIEHPDAAMAVISRAALLLFLSTSSTRQILIKSGCKKQSLSFFLEKQLEKLGIIADPSQIDDPLDMWVDIQDTINSAHQWRMQPASANKKLGSWRSEQPHIINNFSGFQLAGIWGILP